MDKLTRFLESLSEEISPAENKKRNFFLTLNFTKDILRLFKETDDYSAFEELIAKAPDKGKQFLLDWSRRQFDQVQRIKQELIDYCCGRIGVEKDQEMLVLMRESIFRDNLESLEEEFSKKFTAEKSHAVILKLKSILSGVEQEEKQTHDAMYSQDQIKQIQEYFKNYSEYGLEEDQIQRVCESVVQNNFQLFKEILFPNVADHVLELEKEVKEFLKQFPPKPVTIPKKEQKSLKQPATKVSQKVLNMRAEMDKILKRINASLDFPVEDFTQDFKLLSLTVQTMPAETESFTSLKEIQLNVPAQAPDDEPILPSPPDLKTNNSVGQSSYCVFLVKCKKGKSTAFYESGLSIIPHLNQQRGFKPGAKKLGDYILVYFRVVPEENYTIQLIADKKSEPIIKKISGKDFSKRKFCFMFDFCVEDVSDHDFQRINKLKSLIYLVALCNDTSIAQFTYDLIQTFDQDPAEKKDILTKIDQDQLDDMLQLSANFPSKLPYIYCVLGAVYSDELFRFGKASKSIDYFQDKVLSLCSETVLFQQIPLEQLARYRFLMRQMSLKVKYCYGKEVQKLSMYFNYLINDYGELSIDFLIRMLYNDYCCVTSQAKRKRFPAINKDLGKLIVASKRSQLQKFYLLLVYYIYSIHGTEQRNSLIKYIYYIFSNIIEINEDDPTLPKPKQEQFYRNVISDIFKRSMNSSVSFDSYKDFIETILMLYKLSETIFSLIKSHELEEVITSYVKGYIKENKTKESIFIINLLFLNKKNRQLINYAKKDEYIKQLFSKEVRNPNSYYKVQRISVPLPKSELQCYVSTIAYLIFQNAQSEHQKNQAASHFYSSISGYFYIEDVFQCMNTGLKSINFLQQPILKGYLQKTFFPNVMKKCIEIRIWNTIEFITMNRWKTILSLEPILKEYLIDYTISKAKGIKLGAGQQLIDVLVDLLVDNVDVKEEEKDDFFFRIMDCNDENLITYDKVREMVFNNVSIVNSHLRVLMRGKEDMKQKLKEYVQKVGRDIQEAHLSYNQMNYLRDLNQGNAKIMCRFFEEAGVNFRALLESTTQKSNRYLIELNKIGRICKIYNQIISIQNTELLINTLVKAYRSSQVLNFVFPPELQPLLDLNPSTASLLSLPFFKSNMSLDPLLSVPDFCRNATEAMNKTAFQMIKNVDDFRNNELSVYRLMNIVDKLKSDEIKNLFTLNDSTSDQEINQILEIKEFYNHIQQFNTMTSTLLFFAETFKNSQEHIKLSKFNQELKRPKEVKCKDFYRISKELMALIAMYNISKGQVESVVKKCHECQEVLVEVGKITTEEIEDLDDYLTDQEESYINSKNVSELKFVHLFVNQVLKPSKSFHQFLQKLHTLLLKADKFDSLLSQSLESCRGLLSNFIQMIKEAKDRESSFKFNVLDLMKQSKVILTFNPKTREKEATVEIDSKDLKGFSLKVLNDWRDKSLLMINSAKKEGEKNEAEMYVLKKFTELYESLNSLLKTYDKLDDLGYFNDFFHKKQIEKLEFDIKDNNFNEIQNHRLLVSEECNKKWEPRIDKALERSFAICHFQGKQLKKLAFKIFNKSQCPTVLKKILQSSTGEEITQQEFFAFFNNGTMKARKEIAIKNNDAFAKLEILVDALREFDSPMSLEKTRSFRLEDPRERQTIVKLVTIDEKSLFSGITAAGQAGLKNISMPQILLCRPSTTFYEVKTFLLRAVHDNCRPYFVFGVKRLSSSTQNDFCTILQTFFENQVFKRSIQDINLYMIDSSSIQKIYNFISNHKKMKLIKTDPQPKLAEAYFTDMAGRFNIVSSKEAGLGKTFWIQQKIKQQKLEIKYFPVSGNITFDRLLARLKGLNLNQKSALVIQIHNIKDPKILDQFLFQVLFYKCLKLQGFHYLPSNLRIFVELQNILNQQHYNKYESLRFFQNNDKVSIRLGPMELKNIHINNDDPELMFVLVNLHWLQTGRIKEKQISFEAFKDVYFFEEEYRLDSNRGRQLINIYFLKHFRSRKIEPSFIQLRSFISTIFQSLKIFCSSFFFSIETLNDVGIADFRAKYVELLVRNSRQFLDRTVTQDNFKEGATKQDIQRFNKQLRNFPLLVMPNSDSTTFSYVYRDHKEVDSIVKKYILLQTDKNIRDQGHFKNQDLIQNMFEKQSLNTLKGQNLTEKLLEMLALIANSNNNKIHQDKDYSLTLDNFFKMCLIIQRMRARIPINIMGETGVGKTALLSFLIEKVFNDKLELFNIHAGINEAQLIKNVALMKEHGAQAKLEGKKLWVFFDEFNTTQELGYIKEIVMDKRFLGEELGDEFVFMCACNPFRKSKENAETIKVGISKQNKGLVKEELRYKVLPPPESMIECMWDYQELKDLESKQYINTILLNLEYKPEIVSNVIFQTHESFKKNVEISAVNLRDVSRFKILFKWFLKFMPKTQPNEEASDNDNTCFNYKIPRPERAFILSLCFCYYMRLESFDKRREYLFGVEKTMGFKKGYMGQVLLNEQIDYLDRMKKPDGIAMNEALRENIFAAFVCIMNKLPMIIVGMPGCSKSLAIRLLIPSLRGSNSEDEFFKQLPELKVFYFQGSESCSSEGVQTTFEKAITKTSPNKIPFILFDEIGLAELSEHNPLKVLHAHLEVNRTKVAFVGLSNWQLDASKMARFLIINRPVPDQDSLYDTAQKIFEDINRSVAQKFSRQIKALAYSYFTFMKEWKQDKNNSHPDFFGLRDFYSLIKYACRQLEFVDENDDKAIEDVLSKAVQRNFDGRPNSINVFLSHLHKQIQEFPFKDYNDSILQLIEENLKDKKDSRCLLQIIKGQSLVHLLNKSQVAGVENNIISIHGSTFVQDRNSEEYILYMVSDIINYVAQGNIIVLKDMPNSVQTSLYDLLNKSFQLIGGKNYCRIAVGAYFNPRCFVHPEFNCIVYIMENRLSEVDPPFLNRFQKHYLILDKFIGPQEDKLIKATQSWLANILRASENKQYSLEKQHYIINICDQSLASLAIKLVLENQELSVEQLLLKAKRTLLYNSTTDFKLYLKAQSGSISEDQLNLINTILDEKQEFVRGKHQSVKSLMVYTYDENVPLLEQNIISRRNITKTIKMFEIKCQKDLRIEIEQFYSEDKYQACQIMFDYGKQHQHLCLVQFLLDSLSKKFDKIKRVTIILIVSRLTLLQQKSKRHRQVSYLNGFTEVFIESMDPNAIEVDKVPLSGPQLYKYFDLSEIIPEIIIRAIIRFNFTYATQKQKINLSIFSNILLKIGQNPIFIKNCQTFIMSRWKMSESIPQKNNWKKVLLMDMELINLAQTTTSAMNLHFYGLFEDWLASFIYWLIENEVIYCFDYETSVKILESYIPNVSVHLPSYNQEVFKHNYQQFLSTMMQQLIPGPRGAVKKISRAAGQERCILAFPKLFPFSKRERGFLLKQEKNAEEDEKKTEAKQEDTFQDICAKLEVIERKAVSSREVNHSEVEFIALAKEGMSFINSKTRLRIRNADGEIVEDYIEKMNVDEKWVGLRQLFLLDLRNCFLKGLAHSEIEQSIEFEKMLHIFKTDSMTLQNQMFIMLRGKQLWLKLIIISEVFRDLGRQDLLDLFFDESSPGQEILSNTQLKDELQFFKKRLNFTQRFVEKCESLLFPNTENITLMGGFIQYEKVFNNVYYILEGLQNEYRSFGIVISSNLRLMKNFIKTLERIAHNKWKDLCIEFLNTQNANLYVGIHDFLEKLKKREEYLQKSSFISKYQANTLHRYHLQYLQKIQINNAEKEANEFIKEFIRLVNTEENFAHYCTNVIMVMFKVNLSFDEEATEMIQKLKGENLDILLEAINQNLEENSFNNNLSVVLVDFFCKHMMTDPFNDQQEENSNAEEVLREPLQNYIEEFQSLIELKQTTKLNGIQNGVFLAFCRTFLIHYVECLEKLEVELACNEMMAIDAILSKNSDIAGNLRIYCLKLLRKKSKSIKELKQKYLVINKAKWIRMTQEHLKEVVGEQFVVPPEIQPQENVDGLINKFRETGYSDLKVLQAIFDLNDQVARYKLFNFFLTEIYPCLCGKDAKKTIEDYLVEDNKSLSKPESELLRRYANGKITERIFFTLGAEVQTVNTHIWFMNSINWLLSVRANESPLTSIFFEKGNLPEFFSKHIDQQFLICGAENPYRQIMQNTRITLPNNVGVYICSEKCDFMYTLEGCGWPSEKGKCRFCDNDISGAGHQLLRCKQGARRVGPNLLYAKNQFQQSNNYDANNTYHNPFYVWSTLPSLQSIPIYWKILAQYIQLQIDRVIETPTVKEIEKKIDESKKIEVDVLVKKLTGYTKFTNEGLSRTHDITNNILQLVLNSILYIWVEFGFISEDECKFAFANRNAYDMKNFLFESVQKGSERLKKTLNTADWDSWFLGIQKQIFNFSYNFKDETQKHKQRRQTEIKEELEAIKVARKESKQVTHQQLLDNVVAQGLIFKIPTFDVLTAHKCWNRDFFERSIENIITKNCSGQDKIVFCRANKNIKGRPSCPFQEVLLQESIKEIASWQYLRVLRLAETPNKQQMTKEYSLKISNQYPILDLLLNNSEKIDKIQHFMNIITFVNDISEHVNFRVSREIAKTTRTIDFIKDLPLEPQEKKAFESKLKSCVASCNFLANKIGVIQCECKTLGNMSNQYKIESPLINFLVDELEKENYNGKVMSAVFHLFGIEVNQFINSVEAKKNSIPTLKDVQLFSDSKYAPQKIEENDVVNIPENEYERLVLSLSSSFVKYGNGIPLYDFEVMQHILTTLLYGKKRLITDQKQFSNIQFSGEIFTRMGRYSNYLTEVRETGANRVLESPEKIDQKFANVKNRNENNFYNTMKEFQGFLEKLMIFYKNLQDKGINLGDFIAKYNFKKPPELIGELPFRDIPIQCIVSLYEAGEKAINYKVWEILPLKYREKEIEPAEVRELKEFLRSMKNNNDQVPTLEEFKNAFHRFAARCLVLGEIPETGTLDQFLPSRADFWPYQYPQQKLYALQKCKVELSKVYNFQRLIQNLNEADRPQPIVADGQEKFKASKKAVKKPKAKFEIINH